MPYRSAISSLKPDSLPLKRWRLKKERILFQASIYRAKVTSFWEGPSIISTSIQEWWAFLMVSSQKQGFFSVHKPLIRLNLEPSWFFDLVEEF